MKAREKFEKRMFELNIGEATLMANGYGAVRKNGEIIVLVHHYGNPKDGFSEYHYPDYDKMNHKQVAQLVAHFVSESKDLAENDKVDFLSKLALWCSGNGEAPLAPVNVYPNIKPSVSIEFTDDVVETDILVARLALRATEVIINPVTYTGGKQVFSAASMVVSAVEEDEEDDKEEEEYQLQVERNGAQIDLIKKMQRLCRAQLVEMIKGELHRGHNLYSDFDPYPGWGSHQLCGYEIEMKEIKIIESPEVDDDVLCIAFYQEGCEDIILPLVCDFFPIEVLFNIYASMK